MEWLMIIAFIAISILDSKKKSDRAKQNREQRKQMQGQPVYCSGNQTIQPQPARDPRKAAAPKQQQSHGDLLGSLMEWLTDADDDASKPARGTEKTVKQKLPPKPRGKKGEANAAKKGAGTLPTKTLIETRPDREQREAHTKVAAHVAPLKNAFENQEACEHRIELNPNIQYSKQNQAVETVATISVKTDKDSMIQGIIWSEILGKPKAYQPNVPKFGHSHK